MYYRILFDVEIKNKHERGRLYTLIALDHTACNDAACIPET